MHIWCGWIEIGANESGVFDFVLWEGPECGARLFVLGDVVLVARSRPGGGHMLCL